VVKFETVEEIGIIEHEDGLHATVSVLKRNACDGCSSVTCNPVGHSMTIEALNPIHARVGQKVKISIKSNTYLKSSVIVYGIPAIALVAGAVLGKEVISTHFAVHDPDNISAISGFAACLLSFFSVKIWSSMADKGNAAKPVIEEILESK
jgi:sigma-E factor negative regulatory protein RseC